MLKNSKLFKFKKKAFGVSLTVISKWWEFNANRDRPKMKQGTIEHVITVKSFNLAERLTVVFITIFRISASFSYLYCEWLKYARS